MKKQIITTGLTFLIAGLSLVTAQTDTLKLTDYYNPEVYPKRIQHPEWRPGNEAFTYIEKGNLLMSSVYANKTDTILSTSQLNDLAIRANVDSIKQFPQIWWNSDDVFWFQHNNRILACDLSKKEIRLLNEIPEKAENIDIETQNFKATFTIGQNLCIASKGKITQITFDSIDGIENGKTVHRREFGISKGTFWSENGRYLAYYHKDETMVSEYPIVDIDTRVATVKSTRYPMAGMKSEEVTLRIYDTETGQTITVEKQGGAEDYLASITWGPKSRYLYIAELNRDQNHLHLNQFKVNDGSFVKTLFEEKHRKYVEPEFPLFFLKSKKNQFIWMSERDGFMHMFVYDTGGKLKQQLTHGNWIVQDIIGEDPDDEAIYFYATRNSPLNRDIFRVSLSDRTLTAISDQEGTHSATLSPDRKWLLDQNSSIETASCYAVLDNNGKRIKTILEDKNPMANYRLGEMKIDTLHAQDGTPLYYRMIKPIDFNPEKKYPVFLYVYGGPHAQLITNSYLGGAGIFLNYMATKGYVVFTLDNRGSANRGLAFENIIHRNLGRQEVADQMVGVEFLKSLPYVDSTRIGVDGWSYGGFMTISLLLEHPKSFKAGCAGGPVIDWKYYEVMYGERYMDRPQENPEGYNNASLLPKVSNLDSRLLIIHGTSDPTVVWQNSQVFVEKCVKEGKLLDYFIYPGHEHNVRGRDRLHLFRKIEQFFGDFL
jgi:dipeptidyl-peptidase-4